MSEELKIIITAEIDKLRSELKDGQQELEKFKQNTESKGSKIGKVFSTMGKAVATGFKAVATGVVAGTTAIMALSESTEEYRVAQAKLQTAFETAGGSAEQAKETYNDLYRVLGDSDVSVEAANHLAQLTTNQQELSQWTEICQGVYATFGDSLPIEGLTEAANETAKTGELTGVLVDAINWAKISNEEFGETLSGNQAAQAAFNAALEEGANREDAFKAALEACNSEAEREALIRESLNTVYQEAAENYEKNAKNILEANEAQARLTDGLAALGEAVTPIATTIKNFGASLLEQMIPGLSMAAEGINGLMNGVEGASETLKEGLGMTIDSLLTSFTEALPMILDVGIQLITTLIEGILQKLPEVVTVLMEALPQLIGAFLSLLPQLLDAGVQMILAVIQGFTSMLPQLIAAVVEMLPQIINTLIKAIPQLLAAAIEFFMAIVQAIPQIIPPLIAALPEIIENVVNVLIQSIPILLEASIEFLMAIIDAIPQIIPALTAALPQIVEAVLNAIIEAIPMLLESSIQFFMAIVQAIPQIIPALIGALPQIITSIVKTLISSIPKIFQAAVQMFTGILQGISDLVGKLPAALGKIISSIKTNLVEKAKSIMKFEWSLPKLKLPRISISGKFSLNPPSVPKFSLSWFAKGGVFDIPTLFGYGGKLGGLGEDGAEAVVPLEKNTQWLDRIAEMLVEKQGNRSTPIVLEVDGKVFAQTSISTINDLTRQTGTLALNII